MSSSQLFSAVAVARLLDVSPRQIWRLNVSQRLPSPLRVGCRSVRWRRDEIERWVKAGCPNRREFEALNEKEAR